MIRGNSYYSDFEEEQDYIEQINNEEVTAGEQTTIANLERQKTRLEAQIGEKREQVDALEKEMENLRQDVARIDQRIARYRAS